MELPAIIEALLFVSDSPQSAENLWQFIRQEKQITPPESITFEAVVQAIETLRQRYQQPQYAFELREIAGGFQLLTKPAYAPYTKIVIHAREHRRLTRPVLETLAIIAYKQPITRAEIDYIRGVNSDYAIQKLLEKQLIEPLGRSENLPGKPLLYRTTKQFMEYFGINRIEDLPRPDELKTEEELVVEAFQTRILTQDLDNQILDK